MAKGNSDVELRLKNVQFGACFLPGKRGHFVSVLIDKDSENYKLIGAAVKKAAADTFGERAQALLKSFIAAGSQKMCFLPGEQRLDASGNPYPNTEGKFLLSASNKKQPALFDRYLNAVVKEEDVAKLFYSGGTYNINVSVYGANFRSQDQQQITGVFCSLKGIQFVKHGERTGGGARISSKTEFEQLGDPDEGQSDDDLVGAGMDDIPF